MKKINLLLGNCEDLVNDLIEAAAVEVCENRAVVNCARTAELNEFIQRGCDKAFDLVILIPNNLLSCPDQTAGVSSVEEGVRAIQAIKAQCSTPVIALPVFAQKTQEEASLLNAGVDCVLEFPFNREELKAAIGQLLKLPARREHSWWSQPLEQTQALLP